MHDPVPTGPVLVTGASGTLGSALVRWLTARDVPVVGLDPVPSPTAHVVGSVADRPLVRRTLRAHDVAAVVHAGALHKPQVATHPRAAFVTANVEGTLALLDEAADSAVDRFVFTSTTSLMIDRQTRAGRDGGATRAAWLAEDHAPLRPRTIYGVTKLAAEHLCRLHHEQTGLPVVILRTARFFPERDDRAHRFPQSDANTKANELLFRRVTVDDVVRSHLLALERAPALGFDRFLVTADTPFTPDDAEALLRDAPAVVRRLFPDYEALYAQRGWTMFDHVDRVYDPGHAARRLGFRARTTFATLLDVLRRGDDPAPLVGPERWP
ncbi:MAG: NAD(P)-dependent oxidoreductase [Myxococcota bacterium]